MKVVRKGIALLFLLLMVAGILLQVSLRVSAEESTRYPTLQAGEYTSVTTVDGDYVYFNFVPEMSCDYVFESVGDEDTYGSLYDPEADKTETNDDDGENTNFSIERVLTAGVNYILGVKTFDGRSGVTFDIAVKHVGKGNVGITYPENGDCEQPYIAQKYCEDCGYAWEEEEAPVGHKYDDNRVCAICGALDNGCGAKGKNLTWKIEDGVLTISGEGKMYDYDAREDDRAPWFDMAVTKVIISDGVTGIGRHAFYGCKGLTNITIPSSVTSIGDEAFIYCSSLTSITIPYSVTSIGEYAFSDCESLANINIPDSVTSIGDAAFSQYSVIFCSKSSYAAEYAAENDLLYVYIDGTDEENAPSGKSGEFEWSVNKKTGVLELVGTGDMTDYSETALPPWYEYRRCITSVKLPETLTKIGNYAFSECEKITSITIPDGVTAIGRYAFYVCRGLEEIIVPDSVASIGTGAFDNCESLTSITFPKKVSRINDFTFNACDALDKVIVYNGNCEFSSDCGLYSNTIYGFVGSPVETYADEMGMEFIDIMTIHSHMLGEGVVAKEPTCAQEGEKNYPCTKCTYTETKPIEKTEHECEEHEAKAPTCAEIGFDAYVTCTRCDYNTYAEKPALGHIWTDATCTTPKTCSVCGETEGEPLDHKVTDGTCESCGQMFIGITAQPKTTYTPLGEKAKFTVKAEGDGLTYQWYYKDPDGSKYKKCSGTKATYSLEMTESRKDRELYCEITDKYGNSVKTETVTMKMAVSIKTQPKTSYKQLDEKAKYTVKAVGDDLTYQWYYKSAGSSKFKKASCTKATYTITTTEDRKDRAFYCVVTDKYGNSVKSDTVYMRVAASIKTQPKTSYKQLDEKAKYTVKAVGDGLTYQWYYKSAGSSKFKKASCTKATYTITTTEDRKDRAFYCVITDKYGNSVKTKTVYMRVGATVKTEPKSVKTTIGKKAKFTVKAVGDGLTYQWYYKDTDGKKYKKASCTKATYSIELTKARNGRKFYCVVTDKYGNTVKTKTVSMKKK